MSKSTTRRPLDLSTSATNILRNKLGPDFTKEAVRAYELEKLAEILDCDSVRFQQILFWSNHPGLDDYLDRALSEEEQEWTRLTMELTLRSIGLFIFSFSALEHGLRLFLGEKINLDAKFHHSVITHDFALLCTAVLEVCRETTSKETYDRLKKLISRVREFNDLRVKVVHGAWVPGSDGGLLVHVSRQNLQDFYTNEMAEYLEEQAHEMKRVHDELLSIFLSDRPD